MKKLFISAVLLTNFVLLYAVGPVYGDRTLNILVYPFKHTGTKKHQWISAGMTDTVISDLNRIKGINVFSDDERKRAIEEIALGQTGLIAHKDIVKIGKIMGANLIFTGSYSISGNRIRVTAKLVKVKTTKIEKSIKLDDTLANIFQLQDRVVANLMNATKEIDLSGYKIPQFNEKELKGQKRPGLKAFEFYSRGLQAGENNPRLALSYFKKALKKNPQYFEALNSTGWIYNILGNRNSSLKYYTKAARVLVRQNRRNTTDYALLMANTGITYWNKGEYNKSLDIYKKAISIWKQMGSVNSGSYASTLINIGSAYRSLNKLNKAMEYSRKGKRAWEATGLKYTSGYAWALSNIGIIHFQKKEYTNAIRNYERACRIWENAGMKNSAGYALTTNQIGSVYNRGGQYRKALKYFITGTAMSEQLGIHKTATQAWYLWYIGSIYFERLNRPCDGIRYMQKSVSTFRRLKHKETVRASNYLQKMKNNCR